MAGYWPGKDLLYARDFAFEHFVERFPDQIDRVKLDLRRGEDDALAGEVRQSSSGPSVADINQLGERLTMLWGQFQPAPPPATFSTVWSTCSF